VQANIESPAVRRRIAGRGLLRLLFHELPPRVRPVVAAAMARSLKPGGVLVFVDSVQPIDEPDLARLLEAFPAYFHEPYYSTYAQTDLAALFSGAGLRLVDEDQAFLTKAMLFEKV
jgi:SAM-dependent methyltransferase